MRTAYRLELEKHARDLVTMFDTVRESMSKASKALLDASLINAEESLSLADPLGALRQRCEARTVELLALEAPVAGELRQVIASIYVVSDLERMATLSTHIANGARRRHPSPALPDELKPQFAKMASVADRISEKTRDLLIEPNADAALSMIDDDDEVDRINAEVLARITQDDWGGSNRETVDVALMARYYERWVDHCINVSSRVIFFVTGKSPNEYYADMHVANDADAFERYYERVRKTSRPND